MRELNCNCKHTKGGKCIKVQSSIYDYSVSAELSKDYESSYSILNNLYSTFTVQPGIRVSYEISCSPRLSPYLTVIYASSDNVIDWNAASKRTGVSISVKSNTEWEIDTP